MLPLYLSFENHSISSVVMLFKINFYNDEYVIGGDGQAVPVCLLQKDISWHCLAIIIDIIKASWLLQN